MCVYVYICIYLYVYVSMRVYVFVYMFCIYAILHLHKRMCIILLSRCVLYLILKYSRIHIYILPINNYFYIFQMCYYIFVRYAIIQLIIQFQETAQYFYTIRCLIIYIYSFLLFCSPFL